MTLSIIAGGQTGVDTGALRAAEDLGVPWRALFPSGWKREEPIPAWMSKSGHGELEELSSPRYEDRTWEVVTRAGVLLVIAPTLRTPGTKLSLESARRQSMQIWWHSGGSGKAIGRWLRQIEAWGGNVVLMVAGPRGSKWPEGESVAADVVGDALLRYRAG